MPVISTIGIEMLRFQEELAKTYHYKPVEPNLFLGDVRNRYRDNLPDWCLEHGNPDEILISTQNTILANGYTRIVIGDYGAFIEIAPSQVCRKNIMVQPGQEFRLTDEQFASRVKYNWLTAKDCSHCKIYEQVRTVDYADYRPGMYYISPYEVFPQKETAG